MGYTASCTSTGTPAKEVGKVNLGTSPIFNTAGGVYIPLNENEIYVTGMFGPVRISRKAE